METNHEHKGRLIVSDFSIVLLPETPGVHLRKLQTDNISPQYKHSQGKRGHGSRAEEIMCDKLATVLCGVVYM